MIKCLINLLRLGKGATIANPPPRPVLGEPYEWQAVVSGPAPRYRVALAGALPPGLDWRPGAARIAGTPTTAGSYPIELTMTGANRIPYVVRFVLTVLPLPLRLKGAFANAVIGDAASGSITIAGGVPEYRVTFQGTLPPGVNFTLDGDELLIGGAFTASGTWSFQIVVRDAAGAHVAFPAVIVVGTTFASYPITTLAGVPLTTLAGEPIHTIPHVVS